MSESPASSKKAPLEISWNSAAKRKKGSNLYRGANNESSPLTEIGGLAGIHNSHSMHYGQKNDNMIIENNQNMGQPLEFKFNFNQNSNEMIKKEVPMIHVLKTGININNINNVQNSNNQSAPDWDGFQPINCRFSKLKPEELIKNIEIILNKLVDESIIDYFRESSYIIVGRTYSKTTDAEFRITVFNFNGNDNNNNNNNNRSVLECRRSSGETFCYCNVEQKIMGLLMQNGSISNAKRNFNTFYNTNLDDLNMNNNQNDEDDNNNDDFDSFLSQPSLSSDSFFSFGSLPPLPLDFDSNFNINDDEKHHNHNNYNNNNNNINKDDINQLIEKAIDNQSYQDFWRNDILSFKECIARNMEEIQSMNNVIPRILNAITDQTFDCFAIKSYLEIISELIDIKCELPNNLVLKIKYIQNRWSQNVTNQISPSVRFEFHRSQQIQRCCDEILIKINN